MTLSAPAMVRVTAKSGAGTACTVVDKVRGPFASSGESGKTSCALDLLLDVGSYKLRLESPLRGKGTVALGARPFPELNAKPVRLQKGRSSEQVLRSGEQASFWLSLSERTAPFLHVVGKNAGDVRLWKNGEWLEPVSGAHSTFAAGPNRSVHDWRFDEVLEAGEYLLTAYGTNPLGGSSGEATDALRVEYGFMPMPGERAATFTLPATGSVSFQTPKGRGAFLASLDSPPPSTFELSASDLLSPSYLGLKATPEQPLPAERGLSGPTHYTIEPKQLVPQTAVLALHDEVHVVTMRGAPGTRGLLEWAPAPRTVISEGSYYVPAERTIGFEISRSGDYLVGLHDLPADTDAAPLGCRLERHTPKTVDVLAHDVLTIDGGQQLEREFNYDGKGAVIWFAVNRSERYRVQTLGGRKNRCEVWRVDSHGELGRLTESKPEAKSCAETLALTAGTYQLSLYDGLAGVEKVLIREDSKLALKPVPAKASCLMLVKGLEAGRYTLAVSRTGALAARGMVIQSLPLTLEAPVHLALDPGRSLKLPMAQTGVARSVASKPFGCNDQTVNGQCPVPGGSATSPRTLSLHNPGDDVAAITLLRPSEPPPPPPPLAAFDPKTTPLPRATLDQPVYFDFDREESHSLVFEVDKAGLYNVTTLGLLATECRLRTPVVPDVARDAGSGRGRNCLVSGYLRPGRYMLSASTTGQSRGRGGVVMTRRPPREFAAVSADGEAFFRVDAGELVQQKLSVRKAGEFSLATTGQGVELQCRLDDADGWPLEKVPTACTQSRWLPSGSFLWTQLPLTVESMRHTKLARVQDKVVLKGDKPHPIELHTFYTAELGKGGKDEFTFKLEGELTIDVVLTSGMQGHIYQLEPGRAPKPMDVIPPQKSSDSEVSSSPSEPSESRDREPAASEGESRERGEDAGAAGFLNDRGDSESRERDKPEGEDPSQSQQSQAPAPLQASAAPPPPQGVKITLPRGQFKLVTEHSRGDIGVQYQLHLGSEVMMPPMSRELPTPVVVAVKMPRDGTLRLRTEGEADVRCRLFDGERLVFESARNAADWNCSLAEPLAAGSYRLVLESETQRPGKTKLSLAISAVEDSGQARDGATLTLGSAVQNIALPMAQQDVVHEISFRAKSPFSCALEDGSGRVVHRQTRVTECPLLVRARADKWKVRVWTTDGAAQLSESFRSKPVAAASRGTVAAAQASQVTLARAGRYTTSANIYCVAGAAQGLLRSCGPEASLPAGPVVFASFGAKDQPLPLDEQLVAVTAPATQPLALNQQPWIQGLTAPRSAVFLLMADVQHGERVAPACAFDTGVREAREHTCFAASNAGPSAIAWAWAPAADGTSPAPLAAQLTRRVATLPASASALSPGRAHLKLSGDTTLFTLPARGAAGQLPLARLEMTLPGDAWAVLLDDAGKALDLCAPVGRMEVLARCQLVGKGGQLLVVSADNQADVTTLLLDAPERSATFGGLYEDSPRTPGSLRLRAAAVDADRRALVEGEARCTFVFSDGTRTSGCTAAVPRGVGVEIKIEHGTGPLRALVFAAGGERAARLGAAPAAAPGPALPAALAVPLGGARIDRTLTLASDAVVRVAADSGVCGLLRGNEILAVEGLGAGCELVRLVSAGTYRLVVRPFAGHSVPGTLRWTAEPVATLAEGVGPEDWVAPAEVRVYRFGTAGKGWVGLGLQAGAESLDCSIYDRSHRLLGEGCQQYLQLDKGSYLLTVRLPPRAGAQPLRIRPVLLGLAGAKTDVPADYLKDLFRRIGANQ